MRILVFVIVSMLPVTAFAGTVDNYDVWGKPQVRVAVYPLILREEPSLDAETVVAAPLLALVTLLGETGPAVTVAGRADKWVRIAAAHCADKECTRQYSGWVLDSELGYDERFQPLAGRVAGRLTGYSYWTVYSFAIAADGGFTRWSARCGAGVCGAASGAALKCEEFEEARGEFCVATGRLYRYRDAVRGKDADGKWLGVYLRLDDAGELCATDSERYGNERICEGSGPHAALGSDPKSAVEALMVLRRKRVALVAADMLNLRAEPAAGAERVTRVPRGSTVTVLEPDGPAITVAGEADRWVKIRVDRCYAFTESGLCGPTAIGWAVDGFLAYEDRFKPVTEWRAGMIGGYGGDYSFSYLFLEDGSVESSQTCGDYNEGRMCTTEGRLYRYRDLVLVKYPGGGQDILSIDGEGRLCFPAAEETGEMLYETGDGRPTRCDR